ncbi:vacuolar ATPase assembly integral membrane protein vma21 [Sporothrix stenoceras]|uniref:Vacuolar ATPase assembly integral membrane protein vma21 n=1 Tax=Sporothrix stenoceras TaxID=5173 RepID=A0ABR3Z0Q7_9PEZI
MAARRLAASEKTILEKDDTVGASPPANEKSNIAPAVPKHVILKLLGFTFTMIVAPIGSYFATVDFLFKGNSTYAGALAAIIANLVLVAYVLVAFYEDQSDQLAEKETKKDR